MGHYRQQLSQAISDNDLDQVIFRDPFGEVTRKAKRNLVLASFICLLISLLHLEVKGFLGLQATSQNLGHELAVGLACILVVYFFITFLFHAYIDYSSWQFEKERLMTKPYLELVQAIENNTHATGLQLTNAMQPLEGIKDLDSLGLRLQLQPDLNNALAQLKAIETRLNELVEESHPLLQSWATTINKMNRLNWRLKTRFVSLWFLDIIFPFFLSFLAVYKSYYGITYVFVKI